MITTRSTWSKCFIVHQLYDTKYCVIIKNWFCYYNDDKKNDDDDDDDNDNIKI